jgi:guanylate kinase
MRQRGYLVVIDGPSAVGKSTVVRGLLAQTTIQLSLAKRVTTREKRAVEDDEDIYEFVSHETFRCTADAGGFIEHKCYKFGMCYGLPKENVIDRIARGESMIAMINLGNIRMVKSVVPATYGVFLSASLATVRERLMRRGTHTPEQIEERLGNAADSLKFAPYYDLVTDSEHTPVDGVIAEILRGFDLFRRSTQLPADSVAT